jgi:hypothetical protein
MPIISLKKKYKKRDEKDLRLIKVLLSQKADRKLISIGVR